MNKNNYSSTEIFKKFKGKDPSEFSTFPEKIACARVNFNRGKNKATGLSLTEAAERIGISINHLRLLEIGERKTPNCVIVHNIEIVYKFKTGELSKVIADGGERNVS